LIVNCDAATDVSPGRLSSDIGGRSRHGGGLDVRPRPGGQGHFDVLEIYTPVAHAAPSAVVAEDLVFDVLRVELGDHESVSRALCDVSGSEDAVKTVDGEARDADHDSPHHLTPE